MLSFACKKFQLEEVIKCGLGLTKAELKVFMFLFHEKESLTTDELAKQLKLDLSTIQRSVKKLHEKGVLHRYQTNLNGGGYSFHYKIKSKKDVSTIIMEVVEAWKKNVQEELERW